MKTPKLVRHFDALRMSTMSRKEAMTAATKVIDSLQQDKTEALAAGIAVAFAEMCRKLKLSASEMHRMGERMARPERFHRDSNVQGEAIDDLLGDIAVSQGANVQLAS